MFHKSIVYLHETVPGVYSDRLRGFDAAGSGEYTTLAGLSLTRREIPQARRIKKDARKRPFYYFVLRERVNPESMLHAGALFFGFAF